ncbi:hypothetical protein ABRZ24_21070 [Brenneria populi]|uniref:Uncharacterized protein n=1 Tax=Brenneria populi TaxID=1505588 RepID=A0ABU6JX14_9GAMM|nr:hypothetical protein [Brenneria populi Li et al. 2015]
MGNNNKNYELIDVESLANIIKERESKSQTPKDAVEVTEGDFNEKPD